VHWALGYDYGHLVIKCNCVILVSIRIGMLKKSRKYFHGLNWWFQSAVIDEKLYSSLSYLVEVVDNKDN